MSRAEIISTYVNDFVLEKYILKYDYYFTGKVIATLQEYIPIIDFDISKDIIVADIKSSFIVFNNKTQFPIPYASSFIVTDNKVITIGYRSPLRIIDLNTQQIHKIPFVNEITSLASFNEGPLFVIGFTNGDISVWNCETYEEHYTWSNPTFKPSKITTHKRKIIVGFTNCIIKIYNIDNPQTIITNNAKYTTQTHDPIIGLHVLSDDIIIFHIYMEY